MSSKRTASLLAIVLAASGCAWEPRSRPVRAGERLQLESAVVPVPEAPGWSVLRTFDAHARGFALDHASGDEALLLAETDGAAPLAVTHDGMVAGQTSDARRWVGDPAASVSELSSTAAPRFGSSGEMVVLRAEESDAKAGLLVKRVAYSAQLAFVPPEAPERVCVFRYDARGAADELTPARFEASWRALLDGTELRPATPEHAAAAARADDFPKVFQAGLARRSLTLPQAGFQWGLWRERWIAPGGYGGGWGLRLGLTDRLEAETPGYLRYALGEAEGLTRPEVAIGAGLTGFEHDAVRGSVWGLGASVEARRRVAADVAWRAQVFGELAHASRTGRDQPGGGATFGVVWDVHRYATLGIQAGWESRPWKDASGRRLWVGGDGTPLLTVHLPLVDVGLRAAAAWDDGRPALLAGASLVATL